MKKTTVLLLILLATVLSSCGYSESDLQAARQEGYNEGYSDGCWNTLSEYEDDYSDGYDEGRDDGYNAAIDDIDGIIRSASRDAERYAMERSAHDCESAMAIIDSYLNNKADIFGEWHSEAEFKEAVVTLYYFYAYYYGAEYEGNFYSYSW